MATLITDPRQTESLIAERRATGADRYDEVWEGVYVMAPMANNEHQILASRIGAILTQLIDFAGLGIVETGANVSDREVDWTQNYRCPDNVVYLEGTSAENRETHWLGGPDFAVEIASQYDKTRDKFDFYSKINTRELLIVDRYPWALELYRFEGGDLMLVGTSTVENATVLTSQIVPLSWQLVPGEKRPQIAVVHADGVQNWTI